MVVYHETLSGTVTPRTLGPYEFIATPPQQLVLNAIVDQCGVGGCVSPGVRGLAEQTGVSRGLITDCLRTLALDGWISYDGRVIMLLRDPSGEETSDRSGDRSLSEDVIDHLIDHSDDDDTSDRSGDRSLVSSPILAAVQRRAMRESGDRRSGAPRDRSPDRSEAYMVSNIPTTTRPVVVDSVSTAGGSGGIASADRSGDRSQPAAQVMAELGAEPAIIADALQARPDWTPQQVQQRWAYDQRRISASDGKLTEGVFYHALRCGQLAPARRAEVDWGALAAAQAVAAPPTSGESVRDRAEHLVPSDPTDRHAGQDFVWMQQQLYQHDWGDDQALAALADRRKQRGAP